MLKKLINTLFMGLSTKAGKPQPKAVPIPNSQGYENISFKEGMCLTNLPVCIFFQGKKSFTFLLDTGSDNNVVDSRILGEMEHTTIDEEGSVMGLDGNYVTTGVCELALDYKSHSYVSHFLVKDMTKPFNEIKKKTGVTLHGILGSNFFRLFQFVIDFDSLIAYSKMTIQKQDD